jgi:hypothetical protein
MPNGFKKRLRPARIGKYFVLIAATGVIQRFRNAGFGGQIVWGKDVFKRRLMGCAYRRKPRERTATGASPLAFCRKMIVQYNATLNDTRSAFHSSRM